MQRDVTSIFGRQSIAIRLELDDEERPGAHPRLPRATALTRGQDCKEKLFVRLRKHSLLLKRELPLVPASLW